MMTKGRFSLLLLVPFMLLQFLCGCRSAKYVPIEVTDKVNVRDSIVMRDSLILKDSIAIHDSIVFKDSTVLVVDEDGNVIRTELYRYKEVYSQLQIKYNRLVDKYNSLLAYKNKVKEIPVPVEKQLSRWEKIKMDIGGYAIVTGIIVLALIVGSFIYRLKK